MYSHVHISSDEVFSKILKKDFEKKISKWPPKKRSFSSSANSQYFFVLGFVELIDVKGIDMA